MRREPKYKASQQKKRTTTFSEPPILVNTRVQPRNIPRSSAVMYISPLGTSPSNSERLSDLPNLGKLIKSLLDRGLEDLKIDLR